MHRLLIISDTLKEKMKHLAQEQRGFTLIELIMVIVIISILSVAIAPRINISTFNLNSGAQLIASDIKTTQMDAMNKHQQTTITFANGAQSYTYGIGRTRNLTQMESSLTISAGAALTFNSLGEPVGVTTAQTITITAGGSSVNLVVQPYTGLVTGP